MDCINPRSAWQNMRTRELVFTQDSRFELGPRLAMDCGQCMPCRINYAAEHALRCEHEAQLHERSCFLTLTLSDEHFPSSQAEWLDIYNRGLDRIRRGKRPLRFRTFGCLELGETTCRPHGHLLVFGADFERSRPMAKGSAGEVCFQSDELDKLWQVGHASVGDFTPHSAGYVARYALKKRSPVDGEHVLREVVHPLTGEVVLLRPSMPWARSRRPGIGAGWFAQFGEQQVEQGAVIMHGGVRRPLPAYYRRLAKRIDPLIGAEARAEAELRSHLSRDNRTPERLEVRNVIFEQKTKTIRKRGFL